MSGSDNWHDIPDPDHRDGMHEHAARGNSATGDDLGTDPYHDISDGELQHPRIIRGRRGGHDGGHIGGGGNGHGNGGAGGIGGGNGGAGGNGNGNGNGGGYVGRLPAVPSDRRRQIGPAWESRLDTYRPFARASDYSDPPIDYRKYFGVLIKNRWLILSISSVCCALGILVTLLQTPIYQATTTIQIRQEAKNLVGIARLDALDAGGDFYQTQNELLKSRALAEIVVSNLALAQNDSFLGGQVSTWAGIRGRFIGSERANAEDSSAQKRRATRLVMAGLSVEPVGASSVVRVSFDHADPRIAQEVSAAIADNFILSNMQRNIDASAHARGFLEQRLEELKRTVEESEKKLIAYAEEQDILVTGQDQTLVTTNLTAMNAALTGANKVLVQRELLWQQAQAAEGMGLPQILESGAIASLRGKRAELLATYQDDLQKYKPSFPNMVHLRARINEIDRQIAAEIKLIKESLRSSYQAALEEQQSLSRHVAKLKADVMDGQTRSIQYNILKREVDTSKTLYDGLLQRYREIGVAGGVDANNLANNVAIVDRAQVPGAPYRPNGTLNVSLALVLGLMLGGAVAFVREYFDDTFKTPDELEEGLGLPVLGVIPLSLGFEQSNVLTTDPRSDIAEAFRSLRTALQFSTPFGVPQSLLVTSGYSGEGKSTTAIILARNFAQLGMKVLLIDADLRNPTVHKHFGLKTDSGLTNCLVGQALPPEAFQPTDLPYLTFLPCGPLPPNPAELLAGRRLPILLAVASEKFDLVIVDGPPVAGLADAPLLASMTAGTLLVVEANAARRGASMAALKRLCFARAHMVGTVLNKFDVRKAGYGSEYGERYGSQDGTREPGKLGHADKSKRKQTPVRAEPSSYVISSKN
jgi:polysaccharide biosynthesis transport protein